MREFWLENPEAELSLKFWYEVVRKAEWDTFSDVRNSFRHADVFKDCVIFDIGGNKFRLIAKVRYRIKRVYVRFVLTHREYDKNAWIDDCEC